MPVQNLMLKNINFYPSMWETVWSVWSLWISSHRTDVFFFSSLWWSPHSSLMSVLVSMETKRGVENLEAPVWLLALSHVRRGTDTSLFSGKARRFAKNGSYWCCETQGTIQEFCSVIFLHNMLIVTLFDLIWTQNMLIKTHNSRRNLTY